MRLRPRSLREPSAAWGAPVVAGYTLWLLLAPPSPGRDWIGMAAGLGAIGTAAFLIWKAASQLGDPSAQRSWRLFGTGLTLWAIGVAVETVLRVTTRRLPALPSIPDWLELAGALAAFAGAITYRQGAAERFSRVREALDVTILSVGAAALAWLLFIRATLELGLGSPVAVLWSAAGPTLNLVLVGLLARHLLRSETRSGAALFGLLVGGVLALVVAEIGDGYRRLLAEPSHAGLVEAGWMLGGLLTAGASARLAAAVSSLTQARPAFYRVASRIEALLPIAFTYAVVGIVIADWWSTRQLDWYLVASAAALSLLLMARQGVIIGQAEMRQFAALVNSSADLCFVCDKDGRLLLANPALRSGLGLAEVSAQGLDLAGWIESVPPATDIFRQALDRGWSGEVSMRRAIPPGARFPVFLSLRPIRDERRSEPLLAGTAHDLTLVKRREFQLEQALSEIAAARTDLQALNAELEQKVRDRTWQLERTVGDLGRLNEELKQLDRLKSEFVALVSHELKAPLTNIRSGIELVLGRHSSLGESAEHSLRLVQLETERLTKFVETILDLSALEAGRFPLELRSLDLGAVTDQVLAQFPGLARMKREIPERLPRVRADEAGLKSILYHLLDNAIKYAPEGELRLAAAVENGRVEVSLSDSGPGIPEEERERIFEMFHRLDARDEREVYGHGLGLPMVRRLAVAMGGDVRVEPSGSAGARFVFWLPAVTE